MNFMKNSNPKLSRLVFIMLVALSIAISGCKRHGCTDPTATNYDPDAKKDDGSCEYATPPPPSPTEDITSEQDYGRSEAINVDIDQEMDIVMKDTLFYKNGSLSCGIIKYIDSVWNDGDGRKLAIDYGPGIASTSCPDWTIRGGKVFVEISKGRLDAGSITTITYDKFFLDSNKIEGYKQITFNGFNPDSSLKWTYDMNDKITTPNGKVFTLNTTRTKTWYYKGDSLEFTIITKSGINQKGNSFSVNTISPLKKKTTCIFIVAGILKIETIVNSVPKTRIIDFGFGDCEHALISDNNGNPIDTLDLRKIKK